MTDGRYCRRCHYESTVPGPCLCARDRRDRMVTALASGFAAHYGSHLEWSDAQVVERSVGLADALIAELDK